MPIRSMLDSWHVRQKTWWHVKGSRTNGRVIKADRGVRTSDLLENIMFEVAEVADVLAEHPSRTLR